MKKLLSLSTILILGLASALHAQHSLSQFSVPSAKQKFAQQSAPNSHAQSPSSTSKRQPARSRPHTGNPPVNPVGFVNATSIPAGGLTQWSAVEADFNGDGKPDMAAPVQTGTASFAVSVVLNGGNGTFQTAVLTPNPNGVVGDQLLTGDFNGDGKQDLIVVHATSPATFEWWQGNSDGTFKVGTHSLITITSNFITGGVVTTGANGKLDLIFVDEHSPANVLTLLGNGDGTFQAPTSLAVSAGPLSDVAFADFNGDGILDFVASFSNSNGTQNGVFLGQAGGGYGAPILLTNPDGVYDVCNNSIGDLNGDGKPEIVTSNGCNLGTGAASTLTVYVNKGDGTFQTGVYYFPATESVDNTNINIAPQAVTIADVNGDGMNDIVSSNARGGDVTVLLGNGDGTVNVPSVGYSAGGNPKTSVLVADFNGDGVADIVVPDNDFSFAYLQGYGDGTFRSALDYYSPVPGGYGAGGTSMASGDFNGDGYPDFVIGNVGYNNPNGSGIGITVFLSNPNGSLQPGVNYGTGGSYQGVAVGNFEGGNNLDIAAVNQSNDGVQIWHGNGKGAFSLGSFYSTGLTEAYTIAVGDFNQDGFPDLAIVNSAPQNVQVSVLLNNGGNGFLPAVVYTINGSTGNGEAIAAADVNGDGILDLIVSENDNSTHIGFVDVLLGQANGIFQTAVISTPLGFNSPGNLALGDLNGDGKLDLAVTIADTSVGTGLAVAEGNGDGTFKPAVLYSTSLQNLNLVLYPSPGAVQMTDLNGDGTLDLVYSNTGYGTIGVLYNTGTNPFAAGMFYDPVEDPAGSVVDAFALVDVNQDGAVDVAAADNYFAGVTILLNTSGSVNTLAASANPAVASQSVTFTATVAGVRGVTTVPTGSVTFLDGSTSLGSASLSGGLATLSITTLAVGTHSMTAQYSGDSNFHSITSAVLSEVITLAADSTSLLSSVNPAGVGQSVTFTATITSTSGGATATPSGTVTFSDGGTSLGTTSVSSRVATFSTSSLALGNHSITAAYSGDANFATSSSSALTQVMVAPDFALGANPTTMTVNAGSSAPYVISVTPSNGYNGTVAFTCPSTLPTKVTCSFSPTSVSPSNGSYAPTTLTLVTTAATASLALPVRPGSRSASPMVLASLGGFGVFGLVLAGVGGKRNRRHMALLGIVLLITMLSFIGCGGSSSKSGTNPSVPGTPAGTYTVTVTAAGSGASAPTHTLNVTLVVQ